MFHPASVFIGLRYSRMAKGNAFISFISFFSITGISLGLIALITVVSVMNGFEQRLKSSMLSMIPDIEIHTGSLTLSQINTLKQQLAADETIISVSDYASAEALLSSKQTIEAVLLQSLNNNSNINYLLEKAIFEGNLQQMDTTRYGVLMSRQMAAKLDIRVGQQVRVLLPSVTSYTPIGRVASQRLFTLVATYSSDQIDPNLVFAKSEFIHRLAKIKSKTPQKLSIKLNDPFLVDEVITRHFKHSEFKHTDWRESQGALFSAVAMEKRMMSLLLGLIIMVAVFNILSALAMMVSEKNAEIAILQTLGLRPSQVTQVFMIQGLYNGLVGTMIGSILGYLFAANINQILAAVGLNLLGGMQMPVLFNGLQIMFIIFASLLMSFLATLYPSMKAASIQPAQVLRYE